ncbi:M91 family zinc metallopeptidase [Amycolatopsis sp. CA-128772]|uniref:M91 family zinc metallopeptidase n=1 Tax=Amycolatopsis sp. CA-128772 TaxID=2073159 RepID=UPI000CD04429|nr:M91 family zinc metallopeptidase [Amycolatopsis sp. CA-128772]
MAKAPHVGEHETRVPGPVTPTRAPTAHFDPRAALTAGSALALQRQAGNHALTGLLVQRQSAPARAPGRRVTTPFGRFVVVDHDAPGEDRITRADLDAATRAWSAITSGQSPLTISDTQTLGRTYPGFRERVLAALAALMSRRHGRRLVVGLAAGPHRVRIEPSEAVALLQDGGETHAFDQAGAHDPHTGSDVLITLDPAWSEVHVLDAHGASLNVPDFVRVGHELIHARHDTAGTNARTQPVADLAYDNHEEENTIETGDLTENQLREEHHVDARPGQPAPRRHGHGGYGRSLDPLPRIPSTPRRL